MSNPEDRIDPDQVEAELPFEAEPAEAEPVELGADEEELTDADLVEETAEPELSPDIEPVAEAEPEPASGAGSASDADAAPEAIAPASERAASNLPPPRRGKVRREGDSWWELVKTVLYAVLIAVFVRTVLFQPFNIPSASMKGTLLIGDYLFVSKFSYGYSLYSLPWGYWMRRHVDMPGRILGSDPERGDIIVFKFPPDNKTDYIKRLIGLPGDRIQMVDGVLYINGNPVPKVRIEDYTETNEYGTTRAVPQYRETLPNGISYKVLDRANTIADNTGVYVVPKGHYFMMGDNRDDSNDSRADVGMVPYENLVGRARFIWWSVDDSLRLFEPWTWFEAIRYDRIATVVD